jgi:hypothetical protein
VDFTVPIQKLHSNEYGKKKLRGRKIMISRRNGEAGRAGAGSGRGGARAGECNGEHAPGGNWDAAG